MLRNNWPVTGYAIRPAGPPDKCFYCGAGIGDQHRDGCVCRSRTVVVRTTIEHVLVVPEDWRIDQINNGSSCGDNEIRQLGAMLERMDKSDQCACDLVTVEFVREATAEDEARCATFVADDKS